MLVASLYETAADRTWLGRALENPDVTARVKDEAPEFAESFATSGGRAMTGYRATDANASGAYRR